MIKKKYQEIRLFGGYVTCTFIPRISMYLRPWSSKVRFGRSFLKQTVQSIIDDHVRTFDPNNLRDYVDSYLFDREKLMKSGQLQGSSFTSKEIPPMH